jgi:6-phosphogluconolactonase (cycloisomerase 2 family)
VTVYAANVAGSSNVAPTATIAGSNTGLNIPIAVALDAAGRIYVANLGGTVTVYPANPVGTMNEAPVATITVLPPGGGSLEAIAIDPSGRVYVSSGGAITGISVFAANPVGSVSAPVATIDGSQAGLSEAHALFGIVVFPAIASGTTDEAPVANIPGTATTGLYNEDPWGLALDPAGRVYTVASPGSTGEVYVYAPNPVGTVDEAPLATITNIAEIDSGHTAYALALDASGNVYVTSPQANSVTVYAATTSGTTSTPIATIAGPATGLDSPWGIAVR